MEKKVPTNETVEKMVIYDLMCQGGHCFEGWFSSRNDFSRQLEGGRIACPICDSIEIVEKPSAPALHITRRTLRLDQEKRRTKRELRSAAEGPDEDADSTQNGGDQAKMTALRAASRLVQDFLEDHFEDVGEQFYDEAVSVHLGDSEPHNFRGTATTEEEADLKDLGIDYHRIRLPNFDD